MTDEIPKLDIEITSVPPTPVEVLSKTSVVDVQAPVRFVTIEATGRVGAKGEKGDSGSGGISEQELDRILKNRYQDLFGKGL